METEYTVALKNDIITPIDTDLVFASNTLHIQSLKNKTTSLAMPQLTPRGLALFYRASTIARQKEFTTFFSELTCNDRQTLIRAAGKTQLNSPAITALVAQAYFPQEIQDILSLYCSDMKKNIDYHIRLHTLQNNYPITSMEAKTLILSYNKKVILCEYGKRCTVPEWFDTKPTLCNTASTLNYAPLTTVDSTFSYCDTTEKISVPAHKNHFIILHFKKDNQEYFLTLDETVSENDINKHLLLWRKEKDNHFSVQKIKLPDDITNASISNDGSVILILYCGNSLLCSINPPSDKYCSTCLGSKRFENELTYNAAFDHSNRVFIQGEFNTRTRNTDFVFFNLKEKAAFYIKECEHSCSNIAVSYDDSRLVRIMNDDDQNYTLCIDDITEEKCMSNLISIPCEQWFLPTAIHCSPYSNCFIVTSGSGHLLLIKEDNNKCNIQYIEQIYCPCSQDDRYQQAILFSPDGNFAYLHTNYYKEGDVPNYTLSWSSPRHPRLSIINLVSKKVIATYETTATISNFNPQIAIENNTEYVWVNQDTLWSKYIFYPTKEQQLLRWVNAHSDNNRAHSTATLFQLYALNRLRVAYNNHEKLVDCCGNNTITESCFQEKPDIQKCIKTYFYHASSSDSLFNKIRNFWNRITG